MSGIQAIDDRTLRWLAEADHGPLRPLLRTTARAADMLLPWVALSLRLLANGVPGAKLAVLRGWAAMIGSALVENAVVKPGMARRRPDAGRLPRGQRRATHPSTSAFPSGHIGASTAFAVAVGRQLPGSRRPLIVVTCIVAYAQMYTGRHYLSDALAGAALGAAMGALASQPDTGR